MITVVLPAYNEARRIKKCVAAVKHSLAKNNYEIIIAEDGSTDGTDKIAAIIAKRDKKIRLITHREKLGRGLALKNAFKIANGNIICYIDSDLATDMKYMPGLIAYAKKFDVVLGSRYMPSSVVTQLSLKVLQFFCALCYWLRCARYADRIQSFFEKIRRKGNNENKREDLGVGYNRYG